MESFNLLFMLLQNRILKLLQKSENRDIINKSQKWFHVITFGEIKMDYYNSKEYVFRNSNLMKVNVNGQWKHWYEVSDEAKNTPIFKFYSGKKMHDLFANLDDIQRFFILLLCVKILPEFESEELQLKLKSTPTNFEELEKMIDQLNFIEI